MSAFSLFLFSVEPALIREAVAGGVAGVVVDWERVGKERRQAGADTQINQHTLHDLRVVRASTDARVLCRINGVHAETAAEIELALEAGADELLIPMVRQAREVEEVLAYVNGRADVSILVETEAAVRNVAALTRLPLIRLYAGLNDLSIDRGSDHIFCALVDGTLETLAASVDRPFGFGGLTLPESGSPVPCRLLMGEMARLGCSFSFLRRSFHRAVRGRNVREEVERILAAVTECRSRTPAEVARERDELRAVVRMLPLPSDVASSRAP
jgi:hypothetical protein